MCNYVEYSEYPEGQLKHLNVQMFIYLFLTYLLRLF